MIGFVGYKIQAGNNAPQQLYTVQTGPVIQKVIVTGKTKPVHSVDLGFQNNGKVAQIYVDVGSRVSVGQVLVSLDKSEMSANLLSAQAKLADLKNGTRPEAIAVAETQVANAQTDLTDSQNNLNVKILDSYTKSDDAIHNSIDGLFSNGKTTNPQFNLLINDLQLKNNINQDRFKVETLLSTWKSNINNIPTTDVFSGTDANLATIKAFIDEVALAVNSQTINSNLSQTTIDGYKTSISNARTNIVTAINNMSAAEEKLNSAQSALTLAQKNLDLQKSGNTPESIKAQEAVVMQIQAQLANMTLVSPQNGLVTKKDVEVGEIITPGKSVISIISDSNLEVESNVSEINIGKIKIGNPVDITFDAFPGQTYKGTVTYVEPAETIIDGVVNYKVTIAFSQTYPEIKSGLTTNLQIITSSKDNVIRVPEYSIIHKGADAFVSKKGADEKFVETPVTLGLVGQDGYTEVLSGLSVGDVINSVTP